jgi:fumarate hydratase subunit beta
MTGLTDWHINSPTNELTVRKLRAGDSVYVSGTVHIFRDRAFDRALEYRLKGKELPVDLNGGVHWHCGPIVKKVRNEWIIVSAGPTTSGRMNNEEPVAIAEWGVKLVIGKGLGMGPEVVEAMKKHGAAYLSAVGGAASLYGKKIAKIKEVHWLDLGMPEALWVVETNDLGPFQVSIDTAGNNLYDNVKHNADSNLAQVHRKLGISNKNERTTFRKSSRRP